jgi:hypothetical protein
MPRRLDSKDRLVGTVLLHLKYDEALTVMDGLANQAVIETIVFRDGWIKSEGAADASDTYQEVGRQLHKQNWGEDAQDTHPASD